MLLLLFWPSITTPTSAIALETKHLFLYDKWDPLTNEIVFIFFSSSLDYTRKRVC